MCRPRHCIIPSLMMAGHESQEFIPPHKQESVCNTNPRLLPFLVELPSIRLYGTRSHERSEQICENVAARPCFQVRESLDDSLDLFSVRSCHARATVIFKPCVLPLSRDDLHCSFGFTSVAFCASVVIPSLFYCRYTRATTSKPWLMQAHKMAVQEVQVNTKSRTNSMGFERSLEIQVYMISKLD